jgi:[ribosomal protein S5]-alanine N-acetyltransferase
MVRHLPFLFSLAPERFPKSGNRFSNQKRGQNNKGSVMPSFATERLILRQPELSDASAIARALGDYEVARAMATVPHPYSDDDAKALIATAAAALAKGEAYTFAVEHKLTHEFLGMVTLSLSDGVYKLSYWLARPYWGFGYASEAARKIAAFAFNTLKVEIIFASWFDGNTASEQVLEKLGFEPFSDYRRANLARGGLAWCHRMVLKREAFGRKRGGVRHLQPELVEV